jgi:hypothetical protein
LLERGSRCFSPGGGGTFCDVETFRLARLQARERAGGCAGHVAACRRRRTNGASKQKLAVVLGPGLIAGASDDDPSGIATYSQAGAQLGFAISWTMLLMGH